jgi:hypothetical protein
MGSKEKAAMNRPPTEATGHDVRKAIATNGCRGDPALAPDVTAAGTWTRTRIWQNAHVYILFSSV